VAKPSSILLVEDDENDVFVFQRAWRAAEPKTELVVVNNGADAIKFLAERLGSGEVLPTLVVTDLKMPFMDGFQLLAWINTQANFRQLPVLILSGSTLENDVQRAYVAGACGYIAKPARYEDLVRVVRSVVSYAQNSADVLPLCGLPGWKPMAGHAPRT
jgi:CheY-like chemotaxis protein